MKIGGKKMLQDDPRYEYMVGRLVGATEMMTHYLALHGDEKARGMALRAHETLRFFIPDEDSHELPAPVGAWEVDATTEIPIPVPKTQK